MILMYHHVAPLEAVPHELAPEEGWEYRVSPEALESHIKTVRFLGYRFESLDYVVARIQETGTEPRKTAVLTFDDGWRDNHRYALPVLQRLGAQGTFFCTSAHLYAGQDDPRKMGTTELRDLVRSGMTIGAHSRNHPTLTRLTDEQLTAEIAGSKEDLEAATDADVQFFAYPGGQFHRNTAGVVRNAGYSAACTSLGPAACDDSSLFWLYRDMLSEDLRSPRDWYRLSPTARRIFEYRVKRRLLNQLDPPAQSD